jgi:hypothetical protein
MKGTWRVDRIMPILGLSTLLVICSSCIFVTLRIFDSVFSEPPYLYNATDVETVCKFFWLDSSDRFCADLSKQGPGQLELMLERNFPLNQADYWDIISRIAMFPMEPAGCFGWEEDRARDFCPIPSDCPSPGSSSYSCEVIFPGEIGLVQISFSKSNEEITRYGVSRPSGS